MENYILIKKAMKSFSILLFITLIVYALGCTDPKCTSCPVNPSICTSCDIGFGVNGANGCSSCLVGSCLTCPTNYNRCDNCTYGLSYWLMPNLCLACTLMVDVNCLQCWLMQCIQCNVGYGVNSVGLCGSCNVPHCLQCITNANGCTLCQSGYILSSNKCVICLVDNCDNCPGNPSLCLSCLSGYGFAQVNICQQCVKPKCMECSTNNNVCTQCEDGFGLIISGGGICTKCSVLECKECNADHTICTSCKNGYNLIGNSCLRCSNTLCLDCSANINVCVQCDIGFGLTSGNCMPCTINNCLECYADYGTCEKCFVGYSLSGNTCVHCSNAKCISCNPNPTTCTQCVTNYGVNAGSCVLCLKANCLQCITTYTKCSTCKPGYIVSNFNCIPCAVSYCIQCPSDVNFCKRCSTGYGAALNGTCFPCSQLNCRECSYDFRSCQECVLPYKLFGTTDCGTCIDINCVDCSIDANKCVVCQVGFGVDIIGGTFLCMVCADTHCLQCPNDATKCTKCQQYYYGLNAALSTCQTCSLNCYNCQLSVSSCVQCLPGYGVNAGVCSNCADSKCISCAVNYLVCIECTTGYGPNAGVCSVCSTANCKQCGLNYNSCTSCLDGFGLDMIYNCPPCDTQCLTCSSVNYQQCLTCPPASYLSATDCLPCISFCINCDNTLTCIDCVNDTYYLDSSTFICQLCILQGCLKCNNATTCITCNGDLKYILDPTTQKCILCNISGCLTCDSNNPSKCLTCDNQHGYSLTQQSQCNQCKNCKCYYQTDQNQSSKQLNVFEYSYRQEQCQQLKKIDQLLLAVPIMSYIMFLVSPLSFFIVSVQLFGVLQLAFLDLADNYKIHIYLHPLTNWFYVNGYNILNSPQIGNKNIKQMKYSYLFLQNINIMFYILIAHLLVTILLNFLVAPLMGNKNLKQKFKQIVLTVFMSNILFNCLNIGFCVGLHFKYYQEPVIQPNHMPSTICAIISCVLYLGIVLWFSFTPNLQCGEFTKQFKKDYNNQCYVSFTLIFRFLLGAYIASDNDHNYVTLIAFLLTMAFILYNIVNLPFQKYYQNYRANLCHISCLIILFVSNYYQSMRKYTTDAEKAQIFWPAILQISALAITTIFSLIVTSFLVYDKIRNLCLKKKVITPNYQSKLNTTESNINNSSTKIEQSQNISAISAIIQEDDPSLFHH